MKSYNGKVFFTGVAVAALVLVLIIYFSFRQAKHASTSAFWVDHTHIVLLHTEKLLTATMKLETSSRDFFFTGLRRFEDDFENAKLVTDREIVQLKQLTSDNLSQQSRIALLQQYVAQSMTWQDSIIRQRKNAGLPSSLQRLERNGGDGTYDDRVALLIEQMQGEENGLLVRRMNDYNNAIAGQRAIYISLIFILLSLLVFIFWKEKAVSASKEREQSGQMFRNLLETAPDAMIIANEKGTIVLVNGQTELLFGYAKDEIIGQPVEILIPAELKTNHIRHRENFNKQPKTRSMGAGVELLAVKKGGDRFPVEVSLSPLQTAEGMLISASVRDVTARKEESNKLKRSEELFRLLVTNVKDYAIFRVDIDGRVESWNKGAEQIKGYTADEIIGQPIDIFYREEDVQKGEPRYNLDKARELGRYEKEGWRVRKDGSFFFADVVFTALYDDSGKLSGYSKITRDITERKKAEEQIGYLARLIENISDAIFSINTFFEIKSWNKAAERLYDMSAAEAIGQPLDKVIKSIMSLEERGLIRNELRTVGYWSGEVGHIKRDGSTLFLLISNTVTRNVEGEIDGYVTVCRDISSRRKLEADLRKSNAELEAFSYSVSHDLRAPLRGIIAFSAILEEDYGRKVDDEGKRILSLIRGSAEKMGQLIDDLLNFSKMGRQEIVKTIVPTSELVKEVINNLEHSEQHPSIEWIIHPLPESYIDIATMRQVWINLISNAIKYSAKRPHTLIEIGSFIAEGQTVFFVRDNGAGFDDKYAKKLFKVFQRLHSTDEFEGTGVGLAIVEKIISKHGGRVWAEGAIDKGATFYFSLPGYRPARGFTD